MSNDITLPLTVYIELTRGAKTLVDWEDAEWLNQWIWICSSKGYATRTYRCKEKSGKKHLVTMHRAIMERHGHCIEGLEIDHINRDRLCNIKSNLRVATRSQNGANRTRHCNNTSGTTGVTYHKASNRWRAFIQFQKQWIRLGSFISKDDAIAARKEAEIQYFGQWANPLNEQYNGEWAASANTDGYRKSQSGHFGIWWNKDRSRWLVKFTFKRERKYVGSFKTIDEAIAARDKAIKENNLEHLLSD